MASGVKPSPSRDDYVPKHAPSRARTRAARRGANAKRSFLRRRWWLLLLLTPVLLGLIAVGGFVYAYSQIELPDRLPPIQTTFIYDRDGELLSTLHGAVDRTIVDLSSMSPHFVDAVLATEDSGFYEHGGIDPVGIARAAYTNLRGSDNEVQGASTITQQLVKNVYAGEYVVDEETGLREYIQPPRTWSQKIREAMLAMKLEREFGKDRILEQYLNTVYFGHGAYGVEAAARTYFDKPAKKLSVLESATLAGVLHAPELYDPIDRPADNIFRRDYALDQMVRYGYLDAEEATRLKGRRCCQTVDEEDDVTDRLVAPGNSEYFVDFVRQEMLQRYTSARVFGGGLRVTTSLDLDLQLAAEEAIATHLDDPANDPGAALVSIDVQTGQILAMAGGRDWAQSKVNLATFRGGTGRQAGSAFKGFTLAAAIRDGYDLDAYWSGPSTLPVPGCPDSTSSDGVWHPTNAEGSGSGTLAQATANSVNTVFAQVIAQLGPEKVVEMAHDLGIRSELPEVCAITLGSVAVNPLEMTNAYATIAAGGVRRWATPYLQVAFPSGGRLDDSLFEPEERVLAENDANLVTYALQGVISSGTGSSAAIPPYPAAGKTGTANDTVDAWFCGYTVQIATCVWVGFPEGQIPLVDIHGYPQVFGGTIPAAIWQDYMTVAMQDKEPTPFPTPSFEGYTTGPTVPAYSPAPSPSAEPSPSPEPEPSPEPSPTPKPSPKPTPTDEPSPDPTPTDPPDDG